MSLKHNIPNIIKRYLPERWIRLLASYRKRMSHSIWDPSFLRPKVLFPSCSSVKGDLRLPVRLPGSLTARQIRKRPRPAKVIYGFLFNHELDILEIALNTLGPVVDHFVLVESVYTHYGDRKELHYKNNKERFKDFDSKIIHVVLDRKPDIPQEVMTWEHEERSRAQVGRAVSQIEGISDADIFVVVDADEIVDPRVIRFLSENEGYPDILRLSFRNCFYGFYWQGEDCLLSVATSVGFLRQNNYDANRIRGHPFDSNTYWNMGDGANWGGWHASWCLKSQDLRVKLLSALKGDGERWGDYPTKTDQGYLLNNIKKGLWFSDAFKLRPTPRGGDYFAPEYVLSNEERFRYLISPDYAE